MRACLSGTGQQSVKSGKITTDDMYDLCGDMSDECLS